MNRKEKLQLIFQDERTHVERQRLQAEREKIEELKHQRLLKELQTLLESPELPDESIDDDFQIATLPVTDVKQRVFYYEVPNNRAAVIEYIGNDWYPGVTYEFVVDNEVVFGDTQREIAPTNNPTEVSILAKDKILWLANNTNSTTSAEERNLAVVTGGRLIPEELYDMYTELFDKYDTDYHELTEIPVLDVEDQ